MPPKSERARKNRASQKKDSNESPSSDAGEIDRKDSVYDISRITLRWKQQIQDSIASIASHKKIPALLIADASGALSLVSAEDGKVKWTDTTAHNFGSTFVEWVDDRRFLSVGLDGKIKIWSFNQDAFLLKEAGQENICRFEKVIPIKGSWVLSQFVRLPEKVRGTWKCFYAMAVEKRIVFLDDDFNVVKESAPLASTITGLAYNDSMVSMLATAYGKINLLTFVEMFLDDPRAVLIRHKEKSRFVIKGSFLSLGQTTDGRLVAGGMQDDMVQLWEMKDGRHFELGGYQGKVVSVDVSPSDHFLASCGGPVATVWRIGDARIPSVKELNQYTLEGHRHLIEGVLFHPQKDALLTYGKDGMVLFWDFQGRERDPLSNYKVHPTTLYIRPYSEILGSNTCTGICGVTSTCWVGDDQAVIGYADGRLIGLHVRI